MLNDLPTIITRPGEYRLRNGGKATIHQVAAPVPGSTIFAAKGSVWKMFRGALRPRGYSIWHVSGRAFPLKESPTDIVAVW